MPRREDRWVTPDDREFETEREAILHESVVNIMTRLNVVFTPSKPDNHVAYAILRGLLAVYDVTPKKV